MKWPRCLKCLECRSVCHVFISTQNEVLPGEHLLRSSPGPPLLCWYHKAFFRRGGQIRLKFQNVSGEVSLGATLPFTQLWGRPDLHLIVLELWVQVHSQDRDVGEGSQFLPPDRTWLRQGVKPLRVLGSGHLIWPYFPPPKKKKFHFLFLSALNSTLCT